MGGKKGRGQLYRLLKPCRNSVCSRNSPQPCLGPPISKWHDGQRRINEVGKCIRENTAFRGGVRVLACHAAVCIEFSFGRLGVMTTQASWLVQVGNVALIGQRTCWLMTQARESIDSPSGKSDRLHACRRKWQLQPHLMHVQCP